jgi:hypothetical protein
MGIQTTTTIPQVPSGVLTTTTPMRSSSAIQHALPQDSAKGVRVPNSAQRVLDWIQKAVTYSHDHYPVSPWGYLSNARNHDGLDKLDDNLAAAERYFDGYDGNYSETLIVGMTLLKELREVHVGDKKPFEKIFGRNGSQSPEFVTRWGMMGIFDRNNGITPAQRVLRGAEVPR